MLMLVTACSTTDLMQQRIETQMAAPDRHEFDLRRDAARKPYEMFRFMQLETGMTALDVGAYAGYTSEMLSAAVGPRGKVYLHNTENVLHNYADGYYDRTVKERLANNRLPNTELHLAEYDDIGLTGSVDFAFIGNLLHDFYYRDGVPATMRFLTSIKNALKPGGVLGVMDHVGGKRMPNGRLHRMEPELARQLLQDAGYIVEAESSMFANEEDDHTMMVYNEAIYLQTDRFLIRARKPESTPL